MSKGRPAKGNYWRLRLDTILLLMTLAAVGVAYFQSKTSRSGWQAELNRVAAALGLPKIHDFQRLEVVSTRPADGGKCGWSVWVPPGQTATLKIATHHFTQMLPHQFDQFPIPVGRSRVELFWSGSTGQSAVCIGTKKIFLREQTREWNIGFPPDISLTNYDQPARGQSSILFRAYGNARLQADETYDPAKHRFGLQIWIDH